MSWTSAFTECPLAGCGAKLIRSGDSRVVCVHEHVFAVYAHGALQQIVHYPDTMHPSGGLSIGGHRPEGPIFFDQRAFITMIDREARLHNAIVRYSEDTCYRRVEGEAPPPKHGPGRRFLARIAALAVDLRDEAKLGKPEGYKTQLDTEVQRMIEDGHLPDRDGGC